MERSKDLCLGGLALGKELRPGFTAVDTPVPVSISFNMFEY